MAFFFASGLNYAVWGVHIPAVVTQFKLSPLLLTWALLALALGAMSVMGPTGRWIGQVGSAKVCGLGALLVSLTLITIPNAPGYAGLLAILFVFGAGNGIFDTAMNAQAVTFERQSGQSVLSAMHGMFSVGGIAGAVLGSASAVAAWPAWGPFLVAALVSLLVVGWGSARLLPDQITRATATDRPVSTSTASNTSKTSSLRTIGVLAFCGLLIEGAMYDWTTVYLRDVVQATAAWASAGYGAFCGGMTLGRFTGDRARARWGDVPLLRASSALAVAGLVLALWHPGHVLAALGFGLIGLGCANLVPVLFAAGARASPEAPAAGIATVSRLAYVGFLIGPVAVGLVAEHAGLSAGLALVGLSALWIASQAGRVLRR